MASTSFSADLGRNQFLQLLATQLQHQDPMEPVGQQEFLAQMAQFSAVEGIENLNRGFREIGSKLDKLIESSSANSDAETLQLINSGADLLGRQVRFGQGSDDAGLVSAIRPDEGQILIQVGNSWMPISAINSVSLASE